jgi:hypothetical protein
MYLLLFSCFLPPEAPDLVPDLGEFERSLRYYPYLDQQIIYYLTCAREENCLASSANGKPSSNTRLVSSVSICTCHDVDITCEYVYKTSVGDLEISML